MQHKFITLLIFCIVIMIGGNLVSQVNTRSNPEIKETLSAVAKYKEKVEHAYKSVDDYCIPSANCAGGAGFDSFVFAGIQNLNTGCSPSGYGDFTAIQGSVEIGMSYPAGFVSNSHHQMVSMWVDFNNDEEFSEIERILTDFELPNAGIYFETEVEIPEGANPGVYRLRIGANYQEPSSLDPCASFQSGEWEDYTLEIIGEETNYDAGLISIENGWITEQEEIAPMATVVNLGTETITFPVTCTIEGTAYTSTIEVQELAYGETIQLEFDVWNGEPGTYTIEVMTELDGDENPDNDVLTHDISIVEWVPQKMVVGEEGTGTWCGWCVRGIVYMDSMNMKYPETWIGIAVHNGDPMLVPEYDDGIGEYIESYPSGVMDREFVADPLEFEAAYLSQITKVAPANIIIEDKVFNEETGELTFTLTSEFVAPVSNYRFNAVLVENEVTGTGSEWNQANNYSGGTSGPMGGYENLSNPIPAEDMVYQDVARAILGGFEGMENSLPETINAGETHSWEFTTTIDGEWDNDNIEVVGMLIDQETGIIKNATKKHLLTVSVGELVSTSGVSVYPNPTTGLIHIKGIDNADISVFNLTGLVVSDYSNFSGNQLDLSDLEPGIYFVKVFSHDQIITKKLVIE